MDVETRATAAGLLAILLWASLALLTTATGSLPPFQVLALAFAIATLLGLLRVAAGGPKARRELRQPAAALILSTCALFGYHAFYFIALKNAPTIEANLLNYLWPLLIVVFVALLPNGRVNARQWAGTVLGLAAAVLLVARGGAIALELRYLPGYAAALGAALVWAAYSVLNRRHAQVPSDAILVPCALVALLGAGVHVASEAWVWPQPRQWLVLAMMGAGPVGAAFLLWDHATKRGNIVLLGSLSYLAPLLSTLLLVVAGRAQPHPVHALAVALLLAGGWLSLSGRARSD